jgi:glycosyltransferase involved in cell wall biosynthesis
MKIMIIIKNLTGGGAERVGTNLATCLAENQKDVTLVVINGSNNIYGSTVKMIDLEMTEDKGKTKLLWHLKVFYMIRKLKRALGITHSISFMSEPDLANVLSKRKDKVIISVRNKHSSLDKSKILALKNKLVFQQADAIVSLSNMVKMDLIDNYGVDERRIKAIYNSCYIDRINDSANEKILTQEEETFFRDNAGKIIITAGRLVEQKGQWHLIRCFVEVLKKVPDAKLVILGAGDLCNYLKQLINELDLCESILLVGHKSNPYAYMKKADMFAFSSLFEGLGNILIECMALGLPIVSADCPYGPKELLAPNEDCTKPVEDTFYGEYGILVPPMDGNRYKANEPIANCEMKLAETIVKMLSDQDLLKQYRALIKLRGKDFQPEIINTQWLDVLNNL